MDCICIRNAKRLAFVDIFFYTHRKEKDAKIKGLVEEESLKEDSSRFIEKAMSNMQEMSWTVSYRRLHADRGQERGRKNQC